MFSSSCLHQTSYQTMENDDEFLKKKNQIRVVYTSVNGVICIDVIVYG